MLPAEVLELAADQHGALSSAQLTETLGISVDRVFRARRAGLLLDVLPGVVRVASSPESFVLRCTALSLRDPGRGFVGGASAGRLWGLRGMPTAPVQLTVPHARRPTVPSWVDVHRSGWYDHAADTTQLDDGPICVATPLRALWGLAAAFNQHRFERAAEDMWHRRLVTPDEAAVYLERHRCRGKDGVRRMERWLERAAGRSRPSQSNLERVLLERLDEMALPAPVRQHPLRLRSGEVVHIDIAWPDIRLGIEPGASWWHGGDLAQRRDQDRDRACGEVGWQIVRFDESLRSDPGAAARQVAVIHRRRSIDLGH